MPELPLDDEAAPELVPASPLELPPDEDPAPLLPVPLDVAELVELPPVELEDSLVGELPLDEPPLLEPVPIVSLPVDAPLEEPPPVELAPVEPVLVEPPLVELSLVEPRAVELRLEEAPVVEAPGVVLLPIPLLVVVALPPEADVEVASPWVLPPPVAAPEPPPQPTIARVVIRIRPLRGDKSSPLDGSPAQINPGSPRGCQRRSLNKAVEK